MALQGWDKNYREQLKIQEQEIESLQQQLMIAGKGGSPGQPYDDPEKGKGPFVPAPPRDKLAGLRINPNTIMLPREPAPAESDDDYGEGDVQGHPDWKLSHGKHFDEYGQPIQDPTRGMDPSGNPITIPHLQQTPEEHEQNKQLHMDKYHQAMAGPDYIGDKLRYGQLDRILNPLGDFRKPTLDQLRMHKDAYPKAQSPQSALQIAGLNLGGGRFLHNYEIKMLRDHFTGASEKERNRLIEMYSDKPFRGLV